MRSIKLFLVGTLIIFYSNCFCNAQDLSLNAKILDIGWSNDFDCNWPSEYLSVEISLKNNADTTKSFWIMRTSWQDSFISDIDSIEFLLKEYSANFPQEFSLLPSQSMTFSCIMKIPESALKYREFKIGFVLFNERELMDLPRMDSVSKNEYMKTIKTIWSNPLPMKSRDILGYEISK